MSRYQSKYENLRAKMDATMLTLNQVKSAGNSNVRYAEKGGSPLRSNSPPVREYALPSRTEVPVNHRRFDLN
jgi:hypothetical protein